MVNKNMKRILIIIGLLFLIIVLLNVSIAIEKNVEVDKISSMKHGDKLLKSFNNKSFSKELINETDFIGLEIIEDKVWVNVIIELEDNSGVEVIGNKTERRKLINQKLKWFEPVIEIFVSNLSDSEFKEIKISSEGFGAWATEEGLDKIINNMKVREVIWSQYKPNLLLEESASLIDADDVWSLGYNGSGMKVCVIDSGIDSDNMYLEDSIVDEKCYNSDNGCPNNLASDDSAEDEHGHGTQVAGVVASEHSFEKGIAHGADLYVVRVTDDDGEYSGSWIDLQNAIDWCRNQGVDVISMSFGNGPWSSGSCPSDIDTSITNAYNAGISLIVASGNDAETNKIRYPACNSQTIAVGATYDVGDGTEEVDWCEGTGGWWYWFFGWKCSGSTYECEDYPDVDGIACWGNRGTDLDLLAPGYMVTTPAIGGGVK